ncbi:hypothetical protein [Bradyrhizobium sp. BWC-3-1]|nr:hypothetical protein [Bradyrhizobium sp. BWC-3-1]WOH55299.1 hypothetical protein RX329_23595 [Bradyrhizobium sp. BWC-3-1]
MRTYANAYFKEKSEALDLWAEHLMRLVEGDESNVILLRSKA